MLWTGQDLKGYKGIHLEETLIPALRVILSMSSGIGCSPALCCAKIHQRYAWRRLAAGPLWEKQLERFRSRAAHAQASLVNANWCVNETTDLKWRNFWKGKEPGYPGYQSQSGMPDQRLQVIVSKGFFSELWKRIVQYIGLNKRDVVTFINGVR